MLDNRRRLLYLALLMAMLVALRDQWSRLQDPHTIQDDFRKFHWLRRYEDPELFVDDPLTSPTEVRLGPLHLFVDETRPGYSLLFFLTSPLFPPVTVNKLLIFPLLLLSVYFLFRIGEIAKDPPTGFTLALAFIVLTPLWTSATSVAAGLPRSFMAPLLLGIVYFLMIDRYWAATGVALIAATIYWPGAVLGITTIALATIEPAGGRWRYRIVWRRILPLVVFFVLVLLMLPIVAGRLQGIWTSLFEQELSIGAILSNPNYISGGRWPLFRDFPFQGLGALTNNYMNLWLLIVLTPLSAAIYLLRPQAHRRFPRALKLLFLASVILYILSWLALLLTSSLLLYFPSRYTQTSLALVLLLFVVMNLGPAIRTFWMRLRNQALPSKVLTIAAGVVTAVAIYLLLGQDDLWNRLGAIRIPLKGILLAAYAFLVGSIVLVGLNHRPTSEPAPGADRLAHRKEFSILFVILLAALALVVLPADDHHFVAIEPSAEDLITFLQTTPKNSLTAGHACSLNDVPMAAGRQVLFSCEFYTRSAANRVLDNYRAYYSDSLSEVREFCQTYGVDYFVVVPDQLSNSERKWIFFEPYNSILNAEITSGAGYVLEDIPANLQIFEGENHIVMQCGLDDIGEVESQATQVEGLGILAYNEVPETLSQAEEVELVVKWVADAELLADYDVCFSFKDESGQSRQEICEPLSPRLPTSQWQIPEIRYEAYNLQISPYLESGDYSIVASVNPGEETDSGRGIVIGEAAYSALPRTFGTTDINPETDYSVIWGDAIALADFAVAESESATLDLDVRWHTLERLPESYKVFAHLRKADSGEIAGQIDAVPRNWTYPTDWWETNEIITDTFSIPLTDLGPGRFELWLGFYNEESGERLPLPDSSGLTLSTREDAVKIYEFER
jgi:hypothetical protein